MGVGWGPPPGCEQRAFGWTLWTCPSIRAAGGAFDKDPGRRTHATPRHQCRRRARTGWPIYPRYRSERVSRTLYVSGQVGVASDGSAPESAEAQSALAWRNLRAQLRAAGMGIENLVKITTIVPDPDDIPAGRAGRADVLGAHRPVDRLGSRQSGLEGRGGGHCSRLRPHQGPATDGCMCRRPMIAGMVSVPPRP